MCINKKKIRIWLLLKNDKNKKKSVSYFKIENANPCGYGIKKNKIYCGLIR